MSRITKTNSFDYKIEVADNGTIRLDTGTRTGRVIVTGNLEVQGSTFRVDSEDFQLVSNFITLAQDTVGDGLPSSFDFQAGVEVERGNFPNAKWVFDEQVAWTLGGDSGNGTFYAIIDDQKLPLNTPGIFSNGTLYVNTGFGAINVSNSVNYETNAFVYDQGVINLDENDNVVVDNDVIPNVKALVDYVEARFNSSTSSGVSSISDGDTKVEAFDRRHDIEDINNNNGFAEIITTSAHRFFDNTDVVIEGVQANGDSLEDTLNGNRFTITEVVNEVKFRIDADVSNDNTNAYSGGGIVERFDSDDPNVSIKVNGSNVSNYFEDRVTINDIRFDNQTISPVDINTDLIFRAPGIGSVKVEDVLELPKTPHDSSSFEEPLAPNDGVKIYTKNQGVGKTGLFFKNEDGGDDELISRRKSILFSMIF